MIGPTVALWRLQHRTIRFEEEFRLFLNRYRVALTNDMFGTSSTVETHLQCVALWGTSFLGLRKAFALRYLESQLRCRISLLTSRGSRFFVEKIKWVRRFARVFGQYK